MAIDMPARIAILVGMIVLTAFLIFFLVRLFRGNGPAPSLPNRMLLPVLFFLPCAFVLSFVTYEALASGEIYCLGGSSACRANASYSVARDPLVYWVGVTVSYLLAALTGAAGIAGLIGPKPWRQA